MDSSLPVYHLSYCFFSLVISPLLIQLMKLLGQFTAEVWPHVCSCGAVQTTAHIKRALVVSSWLTIHLIILHVNGA